VAFDNLQFMGARDRAGIQYHDKLFDLSGAPREPNSGKEFGQVIAEAAGLDGESALAARESEAFFGSDGFGFDDFLDLINPLQHIPIISTIYREITGDTISQGARILGGAIFGGPLGFAAALGNAVVKQVADKDVGELALSLFDSDAPESEIRSAAFTPTPVASDPGAEVLARISPAAGPAPAPPIDIAPGEKPAELAARPDALVFLDRMDGAQKALLLSSLGLTPESAKNAATDASVSTAIPDPKETNALIPHAATVSSTVFSTGNKMDWPEAAVPHGIDPSSPDWIAKSMSRALDKYEKSFGGADDRGDLLDSKI